MKKILFIHFSIYQENRWGRIFPLAKAAHKCGYDVTLITTSKEKGVGKFKLINEGVKIIAFKDIIPRIFINKGFGLLSFFTRIFHVILHHYDYVYTDCGEALNTGWPGKISQWKGSILLSEWGDLLGKGGHYDQKPQLFKALYGWYYLWAELYFRKSADYTIVLSSMMKKHAIAKGIDENKIRLIPGGAITDIISFEYQPKSLLGISENIITLGYIGIDEGELKDLTLLIDILKEKRFNGKIKLITFGKQLSPETIKKYQLNDIVINYGWINFYEDYRACQCVDIYVLIKSQNIERSSMGWPNKLGDYMAIGRPVLLNLYGDITDFVQKYSSGFIPITLSAQNIRETLQQILDNKYNLKEMGKYNRKIAEDVISWEARMKQLLSNI